MHILTATDIKTAWRQADLNWSPRSTSYVDELFISILRSITKTRQPMNSYYPSDSYFKAQDITRRIESYHQAIAAKTTLQNEIDDAV